jgi:hypothetical protein
LATLFRHCLSSATAIAGAASLSLLDPARLSVA